MSGTARIYRRHVNCGCTVTFENGSKRTFSCGKLRSFALQNVRQDVWSKREWEAPEPGAGAGERVVLTEEQAERLQAEHGLTNPAENGTITERHGIRISMQFFAHRNSEDMPTIRLPKQEFAHVMSEIASHLTDSDKTSPVFVKRIGNYQYTVEKHGFGNYRIIAKRKIRNG